MSKRLTDRQERFCQEYLIDLNATQAAIRAGYKEGQARSQASRMLTNVDVQERIAELMKSRAEAVEIDQKWVLGRLVDNANRAMQVESVLDGEGNSIGLYTYQGSVANRALELIGKHLGMFVDRSEVKHSGGIRFLPPTIATTKPKGADGTRN